MAWEINKEAPDFYTYRLYNKLTKRYATKLYLHAHWADKKAAKSKHLEVHIFESRRA